MLMSLELFGLLYRLWVLFRVCLEMRYELRKHLPEDRQKRKLTILRGSFRARQRATQK